MRISGSRGLSGDCGRRDKKGGLYRDLAPPGAGKNQKNQNQKTLPNTPMKTTSLMLGLAALALPLGLFAQGTGANPQPTYSETRATERYGAWNDSGAARAGDREFTLGGSGISNKDLDNSSGGVGASLGFYLNDTLMFGVRQTINYANPSGDDASYIGSTRLALDQHLLTGRVRPFVGVNFGGVYGEDVTDTFVAGVETGLKFYVQERTFLYGLVDYAWAFRDSSDADDNFDDGGFQWSVGVGFNF